MKRFVIVVCVSLLVSIAGSCCGSDYEPWAETFFEHVEQEYGTKAAERLYFLQNFIIENQYLPVEEKLDVVNSTLNRLPTIGDRKHWNSEDYWATALETITTFGGDCEDIAIVKWLVLNHLGVPNDNLRLAYVRVKRTNGDHMVLLYVENPEDVTAGDVFVLDNLVPEVKRGYERTDVTAVHLIDAEGNVTLINDNDGDRSVAKVLEKRKIRQQVEIRKRISAEREKYMELNDGRPFLPTLY